MPRLCVTISLRQATTGTRQVVAIFAQLSVRFFTTGFPTRQAIQAPAVTRILSDLVPSQASARSCRRRGVEFASVRSTARAEGPLAGLRQKRERL